MELLLNSDKLSALLGDEAIQSLRCSICLDYFEHPVVLGCGHTFCFKCIQDTARYVLALYPHLEPWYVNMDCPQCRKPSNAYKTSQQHVPVNYTLLSLVAALKQIQIPLRSEASTNTEPLPEPTSLDDCRCKKITGNEKHKISDYVYDLDRLNAIQADLDNIFSTSHSNSNIIDDAQTDIDKIRNNINAKEMDGLMTGLPQKYKLHNGVLTESKSAIAKFFNINNIQTHFGQAAMENTSQSEYVLRFSATNRRYAAINQDNVDANEIILQDPAITSYSIQPTQF